MTILFKYTDMKIGGFQFVKIDTELREVVHGDSQSTEVSYTDVDLDVKVKTRPDLTYIKDRCVLLLNFKDLGRM